MDIQHRLVRQAIDIAVSKAMEDIKGNFEPKGYINMADASAAIYKALSNFIQIK